MEISSAMVFAFHAMEGYLNYVRERIFPDLWSDERADFRESGITGKLASICERCDGRMSAFGEPRNSVG